MHSYCIIKQSVTSEPYFLCMASLPARLYRYTVMLITGTSALWLAISDLFSCYDAKSEQCHQNKTSKKNPKYLSRLG